MRIAACLKLVDRRPEVDPLTGAVHDDDRFAGASDADQAALEWALRSAEAWDAEIVAVTAGPPPCEAILRDALAAGAAAAIRVDVPAAAPSELVAAALAPVLAGCSIVWCGDYSLDRGSGSVPAYLAAHLGAAQALGLVEVGLDPTRGRLIATRRLDRGRRERLVASAPAVVSVEGSVARLRRATLAGTRWARSALIEVVPRPASAIGVQVPGGPHTAHTTRPFRPRARTLPAPPGVSALERIVALTAGHGAHGAPGPSTVAELAPAEAADRILAALAAWGYLDAEPVR